MPSTFRRLRLSLGAKLIVLAGMLGLLLLIPILEAMRSNGSVHSSDLPFAADEVALACGTDQEAIVRRVAEYQETRPAVIDHLLPEGAGGTRYLVALDDNAGMAFQDSAAIGLNASVDLRASVELHERAHLLHYAEPHLVSDLMRPLPPPAPDEYAARNPGEHFAEMAANAWDVVESLAPGDFCAALTPGEMLIERERRVPGTAAFVAWYLRIMQTYTADERRAVTAAAEKLIEPQRAKWDAIFRSLDTRRHVDGTFVAWPAPGVRDSLVARLEDARLRGGFSARIEAAQVAASLVVVDVVSKLAQ